MGTGLTTAVQDITNLLVSVQMFVKESLDFLLIARQLVWGHCDNVLHIEVNVINIFSLPVTAIQLDPVGAKATANLVAVAPHFPDGRQFGVGLMVVCIQFPVDNAQLLQILQARWLVRVQPGTTIASLTLEMAQIIGLTCEEPVKETIRPQRPTCAGDADPRPSRPCTTRPGWTPQCHQATHHAKLNFGLRNGPVVYLLRSDQLRHPAVFSPERNSDAPGQASEFPRQLSYLRMVSACGRIPRWSERARAEGSSDQGCRGPANPTQDEQAFALSYSNESGF